MIHKTLFFQIILGTFLSIGLLFLVFSEKNKERTNGDSNDNVFIWNKTEFEQKISVKETPVTPLFRLERSKNKTPDYAEFSNFLEQGLAEVTNTLPVVLESQSVKKQTDVFSPFLPPRLSEQEIHNRIWPPEYVEGLRRIEAQLIREGFVEEEERNAFATDQNMYDFLLTLTEYAYAKRWITTEEHKNFTRGIIKILPETIGKEKAMLKRTGTFGALLPKDQHFAASKSYRQTITDFLDGLSYVFSFIETANAAWITKGDCYKDDNPFYYVPGPNLASFCCNCGLLCKPTCKFVPDCGTGGKGCNVHYGCLNFTCAKWPNAIWDKDTGICGCG